jgi:cytochrome c-type biogenesis protein CcmH
LSQLGPLKIALVLAASITAFASIANADPADPTLDQPLADPVKESEERAFMREIRCVVCQSQSIDESVAEIAAQLRNAIREQMAAGKSEDEIRDYLVARYGDFVLLDPPFKPATLILWLGPFGLAAVAVVSGFGVMRRQRKAGVVPPALSESERQRVQRLLVESDDDPPYGPSGRSTS